MKHLKELYLEHEQRITDYIPEIKHVDLWSEQIGFLAEEHFFKAPATFFAYRILNTEDQGDRIQQLRMQVEVYLYYETFADSSRGSKKQSTALAFLDLLTKINACFHATEGQTFYNMKRTGFNPVETGTANLLYVQRYECTVNDDSATILTIPTKFEEMEVEVGNAMPPNAEEGSCLYDKIN